MISFELSGETPSKKNSRINTRSGRSFPNKKFMQWHDEKLLELSPSRGGSLPIDCPVSLKVVFVHGDERRRDSDNQLSSVLDLLVDAGILKDDGWRIVRRVSVENTFERRKPRAVIVIEGIE